MQPSIMIDAGHGQFGNHSPTLKTYYEGTQMWHLSNFEAEEFRKLGWRVGLTRPRLTDDPSLQDRGEMARGYDVFMSNHSNAPALTAKDYANIRGVSIYDSVADELDYLEVPLVAEIAKIMGTPNNGVKHWKSAVNANNDYFGVLRNAIRVGCPDGFLIEHGYHTNLIDAKWLSVLDNLRILAKAKTVLIDGLWRTKHGVATPESEDVILKRGDKGEDVYLYQTAVKALGYDMGIWKDMKTGKPTGCDGSFGAHTETVTIRLQKEYGLSQTGIVDMALYGRIANDSRSGVSQSTIDSLNAKIRELEGTASKLRTESAGRLADLKKVAGSLKVLDLYK